MDERRASSSRGARSALGKSLRARWISYIEKNSIRERTERQGTTAKDEKQQQLKLDGLGREAWRTALIPSGRQAKISSLSCQRNAWGAQCLVAASHSA